VEAGAVLAFVDVSLYTPVVVAGVVEVVVSVEDRVE
jgi:hypothetical protein